MTTKCRSACSGEPADLSQIQYRGGRGTGVAANASGPGQVAGHVPVPRRPFGQLSRKVPPACYVQAPQQGIGTMMGRLSITETNEQVILSWLGLHAAFTKAGLPETWQVAIREVAGATAVSDWLADFGSLDRPDGILPGAQLRNVLQLRPGLT